MVPGDEHQDDKEFVFTPLPTTGSFLEPNPTSASSRCPSPGSIAQRVPAAEGNLRCPHISSVSWPSKPYGTLYIGVTNGLIRRIDDHRAGTASRFTAKYKVYSLVWYREFADVKEAIQREKTMKEWPRQWKIDEIERHNPRWVDLYPSLPGVRPDILS